MKSSSLIPSFFLSVLLVLMFTQTTEATSAIMLSDTELIVNSRLIVSGNVVSVSSDWDPAGSMIWTYVEIKVDRMLKGHLRETTIVLKQMGGEVNGFGVRTFGQPEFKRGERVLLYLNSGIDGSLHSAHSFMGTFAITRDSSGIEYVERSVNSSEIELLDRAGNGEVTNRAVSGTYFRMIRRTLKTEAPRVAAVEAALSAQPMVAVPLEYSKRQRSGSFSPEFSYVAGPLRWMEADLGQPVRYYVNPNSCPVAGGGSAETGRAMAAWPNQSGANIQLQVAGQTGSCGISFDNRNTISFGDCLNQLDPPIGGCSGVVGQTTVAWVNDSKTIGGTTFNKLMEADTVFNKGMDCFLSNSANFAEVMCHELGHSIGLGHSADTAAIMWATAHGRGRDANLGADDRSGILSIYPSIGGPGPGPGGGTPVSITTLSLSDGVQGRRYTTQLQASGGVAPYQWAIAGGNLPSGLGLSTDGTIDGTPNFAGSFSFIAQVIDSGNPARTDSKVFTITIRLGGGSGISPTISSIRVKGIKKLWLFGQNFRADSLVAINGVIFQPVIFQQEGSLTELLAKGKLNLGPAGTNVVEVINTDNRSAPFAF
jgi:matrixin/putative Ig domain-containing protein